MQNLPVQHTANGQPNTIGQREYVWDALGRLTAIREETQPIASYTYNHRGERISKTTASKTTASKTASSQTTQYLYDDQQLTATTSQITPDIAS